jgi:hypothetical protein
VLVLAAGCRASPPPLADGTALPPVEGPYPSFATCTPASAEAQNVVGKPDGKTVDMAGCSTLQVSFTSGTIVPALDAPDLAIHTTRADGITRIEASSDGSAWTIAGFVGDSYPDVPPKCRAEAAGGQLRVFFDRCNYLTDVAFIRLQRELSSKGGLVIDAIEALSFKPHAK